ncbi:hypothetical protein [Streptomyces californicus]|uniref:hypothetical protein n=1 Tax=Streptomyces californicus TaxID=67351 RepID=UPI0035D6EB85
MSERTLSPDGDWVSAGTFDLRIVGSDPLGTFRVRPASSTEPRRFKDCDGDTWTEFKPGMLRLTKCAGDRNAYTGLEGSIEDTEADHGPLTEIRPDVDVRALLADVLEELATEANRRRFVSADCAWIANTFTAKAQELREESA